jgi:hypothetical protein
MRCHACQAKVNEFMGACPNCGADVPTDSRHRSRKPLAIAGALVVAALAVALLWSESSTHGRPAASVPTSSDQTGVGSAQTSVSQPATLLIPHRPDVSSSVDDGIALPDGTYFGFLRDANPTAMTVQFDLAQAFRGQAATQAEIEDGADLLDGYVRNPTEAARVLPVAAEVIVTRVATGCCTEGTPGNFTELAASFSPTANPHPDYSDAYRGPHSQYWLTIANSVVTRIDEEYHS